MDRCALFVDAGHLLAEGGKLCCGTKRRNSVVCEYAGIVSALAELATTNCTLPVLRVYWYDGARDAIPTLDHLDIAELANVKLRLGRLSGGKQKGVDALIYRDLMTLARERAIATAFLVAGDEDLREASLPLKTWASGWLSSASHRLRTAISPKPSSGSPINA